MIFAPNRASLSVTAPAALAPPMAWTTNAAKSAKMKTMESIIHCKYLGTNLVLKRTDLWPQKAVLGTDEVNDPTENDEHRWTSIQHEQKSR